MTKPKVFISYSHRDEKYKDELLRHLRGLERQGVAAFWDTSLIAGGENWSAKIQEAIGESSVAVLLISPDFLASDYVVRQELPALLQRAEGREVLVLPVLIRPTQWTAIPELAQFQFLNPVGQPISTSESRDEVWAQVAEKISDILLAVRSSETAEPSEARSRSATPLEPTLRGHSKTSDSTSEGLVFLSHSKVDGDFAELTKLRLERQGFSAWIDTDRLAPGVDWRHEIDTSIKKSIALVAIMSPDARNSEYVTYEWAFAWGGGVRVIPLMLRETPLHPRLAALQYLDFTNRRARPWDSLLKALQDANAGS